MSKEEIQKVVTDAIQAGSFVFPISREEHIRLFLKLFPIPSLWHLDHMNYFVDSLIANRKKVENE